MLIYKIKTYERHFLYIIDDEYEFLERQNPPIVVDLDSRPEIEKLFNQQYFRVVNHLVCFEEIIIAARPSTQSKQNLLRAIEDPSAVEETLALGKP